MIYRFSGLLITTLLTASCFAESQVGIPQDHPDLADFVQRAESEYGLPPAEVLALLGDATFKQSIVDAMTRPAERKPWHEYRPIFITEKRIDGGVDFWMQYEAQIQAAAERYQVDPQIIVAIIGVETLYGRITGNYRVIDALATLSFYYPDTGNDRSDFFSDEFMQFILLGQEEGIPILEAKGSYAGAMGLGQFIPSSYREYAVDMDADGRRDLWSSMDDITGSVANYLHRHGWEYGQPVVLDATAKANADQSLVEGRNYKPEMSVADLAAKGYVTEAPVDPDLLAAVVSLEEDYGDRLWLTFKNFYVITRYNRSPLYAMAVFELSQAILAAKEG